MAPVVPEKPPQLLPGPTARYWALRSVRYTLIAAAGFPFFLAAPVLRNDVGQAITWLAVGWVVWWAIMLMRASVSSWRIEHRELEAGYTTLAGQYPRYWHLDPKTGEVTRPPRGRSLD